MVISHNLNAMNAHRQMKSNTTSTGKSIEKLSSGLRINRAGDDAAGLSISEKMRAQIRGLNQASTNAEDGISMIQTTEGALNETHSILQRMRELSVQASNGTNTDDDRTAIQEEIKQLTDEIDRIGNDTEFNTMKLIDGSMAAKKAAGTSNAAVIGNSVGSSSAATGVGTAYTKSATALDAVDGTKVNTVTVDGAKIDFTLTTDQVNAYKAAANDEAKLAELVTKDINDAIDAYNTKNDTNVGKITATFDTAHKLNITSGTTGATSTIGSEKQGDANSLLTKLGFGSNTAAIDTVTGVEGKFTAAGAGAVDSIDATDKSVVTIDGIGLEVTWANTGAQAAATNNDMTTMASKIQEDINASITAYNAKMPSESKLENVTVSVKDGSFVVESGSSKSSSSISFDKSTAASALGLSGQSSKTQGGGVEFQIGANEGQTIKVTIDDMRAEALGINKIDLSEQATAKEATTTIDDAIKKVSAQRANLGAVQNRLEHTINNLGTSSENLTSAESRIRDTDMAAEMSEYSKNNILQQAAQAMLAQAKSAPQQVLQLLQ